MSVFKDIREYVAIRRVTSLRLSPDGARLVSVVQSLNPDGKSYGTAVWEIDPAGERPAARLTRSAKGEAGAEFTSSGDLLFTARRPDPEAKEGGDDADVPALWLLPRAGGEARRLLSRPHGVSRVRAAAASDRIVFASPVLPGPAEGDAERRKAREDAGVTAILHESYPVRFWDHDLGPAQPRLFASAVRPDGAEEARDLTPEPGRALDEQAFAVTPDGSRVITGWTVPLPRGEMREDLVAIDVATGERTVLASEDGYDHWGPLAISPDGRRVAYNRERHATTESPVDSEVRVLDLETGETTTVALWPSAALAFGPDALYVCADADGRRPLYRHDLSTGETTRLTADDAAYSEPCPSPDGRHVYALRGAVGQAPAPVRIDVATGEHVALPSPAAPLETPGTVAEVRAEAPDGTPLRAWLVLPSGASAGSPAPLLLWIHGGPLGSWNDWQWRWNPWIMAAHGYAVLLPDPALSTGYGPRHIERGWGRWGEVVQGDLEAITDACLERPDVDSARVAAMGGSFGGYMANWLAGHTERFRAIVTHASLWELAGFGATTDVAGYWQREFGPPGSERNRLMSPHAHVERIRTPMLVIHGDKDYRVPIGEALRLWWDLVRHEVDAKFLYFPDEGHWIQKPGNIVAWYETVLAFLARHVLGEEWTRPDLL
ncbi:S9 family peptidase [Bailinhaonella thermotolerans]|uniref:S9 family peptidase n=1 Tax=Bailinhaonella thermotolerans TaxID=1070861 RepID=A0A3A4B7Q5_9ACTN|nr:S9 family peptidase [Bailinhaonella thermotolerans]RJL34261.1 S9 family peptidase [Bailinhaonella thermotolerans]